MKTLQVFRGVQIFDAAQIVGEVVIDPNTGYLTAPVNATRAGIFIYHDEIGREVRVLRPEQEVFKAESMGSLARKPATFDHPDHLPDATDISKYIVGMTGDVVTKVGDFVRTSVTVTTQAAINSINAGNHEVSCGYTADVVKEAGAHHEFGPYDMVQKNIHYNHLAVGIPKGRGGPDVRMLLDSADTQENTMRKIKVGDKEYEVPNDVADAWEKSQKDLADADQRLKAAANKDSKKRDRKDRKKGGDDDDDDDDDEEEMDAKKFGDAITLDAVAGGTIHLDAVEPVSMAGKLIKGALVKMQGRVVAAEALAKTHLDSATTITPEKLAAAARSHAKLVATALAILDGVEGVSAKALFDMNGVDVKKKAILHKLPDTKLDGKGEAFVDGIFEGIAASVSPSNVGEVLGHALFDTGAGIPGAKTAANTKPGERPEFIDGYGPGNGYGRPAPRQSWVAKPLKHSNRVTEAAKA